MRVFVCLLCAAAATAQSYYGVAQIRGSEASYRSVSGTVKMYEDATCAGLTVCDLTVEYDISGLTDGVHGFHVHQYGDTICVVPPCTGTDTYVDYPDLSTIAKHFVPFCIPPSPDEDGNMPEDACANDQIHGYPPALRRHPGDMGNITSAGGVAQGSFVLSQEKISLADSLRSVIGRTVNVHSLNDDGTQPYGNAGSSMAFGIVGLGKPSEVATMTTNTALAPTTPRVDKITCVFERYDSGGAEASVYGTAMLTLQVPCNEAPCEARMQAKLQGLSANAEHSFHFHTWGDMTLADPFAAGALGDIYKSHGVSVSKLKVLDTGEAQYETFFGTDTNDLVEHVGRSLTVHAGPDSSSATIAAAACGLAHPLTSLDTSEAPTDDSSGLGAGMAAFLSISVIGFVGVGVVGLLYFFRKPIPFCGSCMYESELLVPPPPPKPVSSTVAPPPGAPPPMQDKV